MNKIVNKILSIMLLFAVSLSIVHVDANAATTGYRPSSIIGACEYCGQKNISYGVMRNFSGTSQTVHAGKYCEGCEKTVPTGKSHYYYMTYDRFSFTCSKCKRDYYLPYGPNLIEHTVTNE